MANERYQSLAEFMAKPFGSGESMERDIKYNQIYQRVQATGKISIMATCEIEKSYYYHIRIPSESQHDKRYYYDVVLRFFTGDPSISKEKNLQNYNIQFFSNSPSFIYHYAYLYNKNGFLISELYNKTDAEYINTPPTKTNPDMKLTYDKSIYLACRYLLDRKNAWLLKLGPATAKRVNRNKFFKTIGDFQSIKIDQTLMAEEKKLAKELGTKQQKVEDKEAKKNDKIKADSSTSKSSRSINIKNKITGKKATKNTGTRSTIKVIKAGRHT